MARRLLPRHSRKVLPEEFPKPLAVNGYRLSRDISATARGINDIVLGKRATTADMTPRLTRYVGHSEQFRMNLRVHHDREGQRDELEDRLPREVKVRA